MMISNTAERLNFLMQKYNLRQADILKRCEPYANMFDVMIQKSDLSQYLSGKIKPSQKKLTILAAALNVNEPWLMGYDVDMDKTTITLSSHERNVVLAYRYNIDMQEAVDRLLGIESEKKIQKEG
jgi:transcriptional regulator with XRE-family HTH domain